MPSIMALPLAGTTLSTSCVPARSLSCRGTQGYRDRTLQIDWPLLAVETTENMKANRDAHDCSC